ncbi:MAG: hypothetical protein JXR77_01965 [Lentisphaeria bacterium]|nr:hypothetical protein [Lentisphaeria bacterium]
MSEFHQNAVSRAAWPWTKQGAGEREHARTRLRRRGMGQAASAGMAAVCLAVVCRETGRPAAAIALCTGMALAVTAFAAPSVYVRVDRGFARFGRGLATGITWLLLAPFFFVCFLGGRLLLRARRLDPLQRSFPAPESSCWGPRPPLLDRERYTRQY